MRTVGNAKVRSSLITSTQFKRTQLDKTSYTIRISYSYFKYTTNDLLFSRRFSPRTTCSPGTHSFWKIKQKTVHVNAVSLYVYLQHTRTETVRWEVVSDRRTQQHYPEEMPAHGGVLAGGRETTEVSLCDRILRVCVGSIGFHHTAPPNHTTPNRTPPNRSSARRTPHSLPRIAAASRAKVQNAVRWRLLRGRKMQNICVPRRGWYVFKRYSRPYTHYRHTVCSASPATPSKKRVTSSLFVIIKRSKTKT